MQKVCDFVMAPSFEHNLATCKVVAEAFAKVKKDILVSNSAGFHVRRCANMARQELASATAPSGSSDAPAQAHNSDSEALSEAPSA